MKEIKISIHLEASKARVGELAHIVHGYIPLDLQQYAHLSTDIASHN